MKKLIATMAVAASLVGATVPAQADDRVVRGAIIGAIFGAVLADASRPQTYPQHPQPVYGHYPEHRPVYGHYPHNGPCQVIATRGPRAERIETACDGRVISVEPIRRGGHYHRY